MDFEQLVEEFGTNRMIDVPTESEDVDVTEIIPESSSRIAPGASLKVIRRKNLSDSILPSSSENFDSKALTREEKELLVANELNTYLDTNSLYLLDPRVLAEKYGISTHMVRVLLERAVGDMPAIRVDVIGRTAENYVERLLRTNYEIVADKKTPIRERLVALRYMVDLLDSQIRILEAYGRKSKAVSHLDIVSKSVSWSKEVKEYQGMFDKLSESERDMLLGVILEKYKEEEK